MVQDCWLWRPVCQAREVMTQCINPLWTKTGVLQKLSANGLHISPVTLVNNPKFHEKILLCQNNFKFGMNVNHTPMSTFCKFQINWINRK